MKPNDEQVLAIKQYLKNNLKYKETKDEMFDHIISALEHMPDEVPFGEAMNEVTENIGGLGGLKSIEFAAKMAAFKALLKASAETFKEICKSPLIIIIAALTVAVHYLISGVLIRYWLFSMILVLNTPSWFVKRKIMDAANLVNVKNDAFKLLYWVSYSIPPALMFLVALMLQPLGLGSFETGLLYVWSGTVCLAMLRAAVFYKLTRAEFKVTLSDI